MCVLYTLRLLHFSAFIICMCSQRYVCILLTCTTPPDTQPTLQQLTHMIDNCGKEVQIIQNIAAKWKEVGILFNFDPTGRTNDLINARNSSDPEACCTDMMKVWLEGKGRQPATWATLVEVLRNANFNCLANDMEQLVATHGGRGHLYKCSTFFLSLLSSFCNIC